MFGGLPKLFDRSFFIGFFLPATLLFSGLAASVLIFVDINDKARNFFLEKNVFGATLVIVLIWLIAILLMAINRPIIRLLEGYGRRNPFRLFLPMHKKEFEQQILPRLGKLEKIIYARKRGVKEPDQEENFRLLLWEAVNTYPESADLVLSTRLGNVMRAYERYPVVVYGIEAIVLWPRLAMILPEEVRNRIREGEALFHFAVNVLFTGVTTLLVYVVLAANAFPVRGISSFGDSWPIVLISAFSAWFGHWLLPGAARQRGEQVKSVFDLYRGTLAEHLGFQLPRTEQAERKMWELISRRMTFRISEDFPTLDQFRKTEVAKSVDRRHKLLREDVSNEGDKTELDKESTDVEYGTNEDAEKIASDDEA